MKDENENDITIPDFGNFDVPDLDLDNFDLDLDAEADTANRYIKPRLVPMKERQIMFEHAAALANEIDLTERSRYDCIVSGSKDYGRKHRKWKMGSREPHALNASEEKTRIHKGTDIR